MDVQKIDDYLNGLDPNFDGVLPIVHDLFEDVVNMFPEDLELPVSPLVEEALYGAIGPLLVRESGIFHTAEPHGELFSVSDPELDIVKWPYRFSVDDHEALFSGDYNPEATHAFFEGFPLSDEVLDFYLRQKTSACFHPSVLGDIFLADVNVILEWRDVGDHTLDTETFVGDESYVHAASLRAPISLEQFIGFYGFSPDEKVRPFLPSRDERKSLHRCYATAMRRFERSQSLLYNAGELIHVLIPESVAQELGYNSASRSVMHERTGTARR